MRQLQWNSIREISVSIYYRRNYKARFSQPVQWANWLHMLQMLLYTIMNCKKNTLNFSSFLKTKRMVQTQEKITIFSSCIVLLLHSFPGLWSSKALQCLYNFKHLRSPFEVAVTLLKSAVKHMPHLNFSLIWMLEFSKGKKCVLQLMWHMWS